MSPEPNVWEEATAPSIQRAKKARRDEAVSSDEEIGISATMAGAVTPSPRRKVSQKPRGQQTKLEPQALFRKQGDIPIEPVTPSPQRKIRHEPNEPQAKRKLIFGHLVTETYVKESVKTVYKIVKKLTGSIGGNGSHGPIYGELTMGSMQKMINLMKEHAEFSSSSRFIDVGSGIGKPNLHVAQDPGVEFSYGIEVEHDRWLLGYNCLRAILTTADEQQTEVAIPLDSRLFPVCMMDHADIQDARSFDPFTHVYMFSIGFPPTLWIHLSAMWNRSKSMYLICYHGPRNIIDDYGFEVELVVQTPTSMHGSKEGHMGYIYKRVQDHEGKAKSRKIVKNEEVHCDPLYRKAWDSVKRGLPHLKNEVDAVWEKKMQTETTTRSSRRGRR